MAIKVALISLNNRQYNQNYFDNYEPLALPVLKGHLLHRFEDKIEISNIDMQLKEYDAPKKVLSFLTIFKPDIIGISVPWGTLHILDSLIESIFKNKNPEWSPIVVLGKQLPSNFPEIIIDRYGTYPILVAIGPGEYTLEDLVNLKKSAKQISDVRNIVYKQSDKFIYNKTADKFNVIAPAFHEKINKYNIIGLQSSRGCSWSRCSFCLRIEDNKGLVQPWSPVDVPIVIEEMIKLSDMGVKGVNIVDENFIGGQNGLPRLQEFIKAIKYSKKKNIINKHFLFSISIRVDEILTLERVGLLKPLKESGLCFVFVGIESCSNSQLKRYNKGIDTNAIKRAVLLLQKYNIPFEAGFILLDPFVSLKELKENIDLMEWNFGTSMLVDFIANPLNRGRIFYKSPLYYQIAHNHRELLRELNLNKGQYDYVFFDSGVQKIVNMIETWYPDSFHNSFIKPIRHIIMHSIHNFQDVFVYTALQKYASGFRRIELGFLKKIIDLHEKRLSAKKIEKIITWLDEKRDSYILDLEKSISLPMEYKNAIEKIINNAKKT